MEKYIYHDENLRCRLKRTGYKNQIELQIQRRSFLFIWANCYKWMTIQEGFWGEDFGLPINPMKSSYNYGNESECWKTGTLDIKKRVHEFFKEYFLSIRLEGKRQKQFEQI